MDEETQTELLPVVESRYALSLVRCDSSLRLRRKVTRIRRLVVANTSSDVQYNSRNCPLNIFLISFIGIALALAIIASFNHKRIYKDFVIKYFKHYQQIVHEKHDYCTPILDEETLFARLRQQHILNQEHAMQQLEVALGNSSQLNSIAIVGTSGVGKSLWVRNLAEHFQWRENVHSYLWSTPVNEEVEKFHLLRVLVEQLSSCGLNLLIVDNLMPCDHEVVNILNELILRAEHIDNKHVIVVYIFRLNRADLPTYKQEFHVLHGLPNTKTISFRSFGSKELKDCIRREAYAENMKISDTDMNNIMASVDVELSGCKTVLNKVLRFGKKRDNEML